MDPSAAGVDDIFLSIKDLIFQHWSFILVSFVLGTIGNFAKTSVWTKERAAQNRFWWWGRASLPLHASVSGLLVGLTLALIFGESTPTGPGINTVGEICLYYMGAGVFSSWVYNIIKHFLDSKSSIIRNKLKNQVEEGKSNEEPVEEPNQN